MCMGFIKICFKITSCVNKVISCTNKMILCVKYTKLQETIVPVAVTARGPKKMEKEKDLLAVDLLRYCCNYFYQRLSRGWRFSLVVISFDIGGWKELLHRSCSLPLQFPPTGWKPHFFFVVGFFAFAFSALYGIHFTSIAQRHTLN